MVKQTDLQLNGAKTSVWMITSAMRKGMEESSKVFLYSLSLCSSSHPHIVQFLHRDRNDQFIPSLIYCSIFIWNKTVALSHSFAKQTVLELIAKEGEVEGDHFQIITQT